MTATDPDPDAVWGKPKNVTLSAVGVDGASRVYLFSCVCKTHPEQYDVVNVGTGRQIGHVRLRHGVLRVDTPDNRGRTVLTAALDPRAGSVNTQSRDQTGWGVFPTGQARKQWLRAVAQLLASLEADQGDDG